MGERHGPQPRRADSVTLGAGEGDVRLHARAQDIEPEVRQSAFALLGDLAGACFPYLQPVAHDFVRVQISNLSTIHPSVCNNAVWSLGEVAIKFGSWTGAADAGVGENDGGLTGSGARVGGPCPRRRLDGVSTGDEMRVHIPAIMPYLSDIILQKTNPQAHDSLLENTGITIGRLGYVCPDAVARYLPTLFVPLYVHAAHASAQRSGA